MKKNKLITEIAYDFDLIGIVSHIKEYKLAWYLNQIEGMHFVKCDDIRIEYNDQSRIQISNFMCTTDQCTMTLLKNKLVATNSQRNQQLLSEASQFDYFLKLHYQVDDFDLDSLLSHLKSIQVIDYLAKLDLDKIKQKENLLY